LCHTVTQPNMALPATRASFPLTLSTSTPIPHQQISVDPLLKTNQWLIFRLIFMFVKVSQTITNYVLTICVMQITGTGAAQTSASSTWQQDNGGSRYSCKRKQERANTNGQTRTQTGECERGWANANEGGQVNVNESGRMGWGNRRRHTRAGEHEWGQPSGNEGGGATAAAAATAGPPPFF
jgi:hypothetical protein